MVSRVRQVFTDFAADRFVEITEGEDDYRTLRRRPMSFAVGFGGHHAHH